MPNAILKAEGLTKRFGAHAAVANVSFEVTSGEILCIIGPNGAGKTTLFNLLTKDLSPNAGRIVAFGDDVTRLSPHEIARLGIGRSYQITSVFQGLTVYDNVWVAAYRAHRRGRLNFWNKASRVPGLKEAVVGALEAVGLGARRNDTTSELSYGDQRLLDIAISIVAEPRLLLLDEPTSGLSQEDTQRVSALIRRLADRYTVVMIEHKMNVVMTISDRLIVMNFGEVIADGKPDDVARDPKVRRAYFGM
jgi:branched-chain amino acid transport system ATP-binding protein